MQHSGGLICMYVRGYKTDQTVDFFRRSPICERRIFMKKRRIRTVLSAILLILVLGGAACGSSKNNASSSEYAMDHDAANGTFGTAAKANAYEEYAAEDTEEIGTLTDEKAETPTSEKEPEAVESAESQDKLVYTCWMTIQTLEFEKTQNYVRDAVSKAGGIIESESVSDSDYSWYREEYKKTGTLNATLTIRIPSENYKDFLEALDGSGGKIVNKSQNVENITKRYNDQTIYIESLEMQEKRLLEMMEQAQTVEEMITVEARLTDVQTELNQARSELATMDTDVRYSTVNLTLEEVVRYTDSPRTPISFGQRVRDAFVDSWDNFVSLLQGLVISVIYLLPAAIFIALIAAVIFLVTRAWRKKHPKAKKEKRPYPQAYNKNMPGNGGRGMRGAEPGRNYPAGMMNQEIRNPENKNPDDGIQGDRNVDSMAGPDSEKKE